MKPLRSTRVLIFALVVVLTFSTGIANALSKTFSDVNDTHQNQSAISYLTEKGILQGYSDGTFKPEATVNRAEQLKILIEGKGITPDANTYKNCFPDVKDEWFAKYVCYAKKNGWVQGYPDGYFRPEQTVNKVEAIKMLIETQGLADELPENVENELQPGTVLYNDVDSNAWFAPYVWLAKKMALLEETQYEFSPAEGMRRAGISENLYRYLILKEKNLNAFPAITYIDVPKPSKIPEDISFDNCGPLKNYKTQSWYSNLETEAAEQKISLDTVTDACYSESGNMFVMLIPGGYMESGAIYQFYANANSLEKARRIHKGISYTASPTEFGKREGDVIKLEARSGDAGCGETQYFDYYFWDNAVELTKSLTGCDGQETQWNDYTTLSEWQMYSETNSHFDISYPDTLQLTCPADSGCYLGSKDLNLEQYYTPENLPVGATVIQIGSYGAEDGTPVTDLESWRKNWEGGLDANATYYSNVLINGMRSLEEKYDNKKTIYIETGTGRVLAFTIFPLTVENESSLFPKILRTIELTYFTKVSKKSPLDEISPKMPSSITIMVPEDEAVYKEKMTKYVQEGGEDPLLTTKFIEKEILIPHPDDPILASAQAAAEEIAPSGGPEKASVSSLEIINDTAYILLNIDTDSWAGASVSRAIIHPLVEKTLLQFSEIKNVKFEFYDMGDPIETTYLQYTHEKFSVDYPSNLVPTLDINDTILFHEKDIQSSEIVIRIKNEEMTALYDHEPTGKITFQDGEGNFYINDTGYCDGPGCTAPYVAYTLYDGQNTYIIEFYNLTEETEISRHVQQSFKLR